MNVFLLGLQVTNTAQEDEGIVNVLAKSLPSTKQKQPTKVQLLQHKDHYVGKALQKLEVDQSVLAVGLVKPTLDGVLKMNCMMVVNKDSFDDVLAINLFMATGGLGPKAEETELTDTTVCNRSIAWQQDNETHWFKLSAWGELSKELSELPNGTPTVAVGRVTCSEKDDKSYLNYTADKVLYLPRTKVTPKKAADTEKGTVAASAVASLDFNL